MDTREWAGPSLGRPADKREPAEERCYDFLDGLGIEYRRVDHPRADTIEACASVEQRLGAPVCKNLFLTNRQQTEYYLLLMPGNKPFRTKHLSRQIGTARLSFAGAAAMKELLGVEPGSVSLLGLLQDREGRVHLVLDEDLKREEWLGCHPCRNTSTLGLRMKDVLEKVIPRLGHSPVWVALPWQEEEKEGKDP